MEVALTREQRGFIQQAIENGRIQNEEDAVREALLLWEERERVRAELLAAVDQAEASVAHGEARSFTEQSVRDIAAEVKRRGRARLAAEQALR